ncbi:MAG: type III pantothenate kinase [Nitrospiraceae bacterium]|nr:MAG: type III pantothenate kinase [Nitrospiraceae bacterium]
MLLLIDIGNTSTKIGIYEHGVVKDILRLATVINTRGMIEYSYILESFVKHHRGKKPEGAAMCSVVPEVAPMLASAVRKSFGIETMNVTFRARTGLKFPAGMGADRIAQAVAARKLYKGDLIVVSFGTATVFSVIAGDGKYKGGAIMPGLDLCAGALAGGTSKLPRVALRNPVKPLSKETKNNILTGVILGHAGAVERIVAEIRKDTGGDLRVIATGGLVGLVKQHLKIIDIENPHLTFEGLRFIYEMNTS